LHPVNDWKARISERLAGSEPQHAPEEWLLPGLSRDETHALEPVFPKSLIPARCSFRSSSARTS
jgi:hypothetical protein